MASEMDFEGSCSRSVALTMVSRMKSRLKRAIMLFTSTLKPALTLIHKLGFVMNSYCF